MTRKRDVVRTMIKDVAWSILTICAVPPLLAVAPFVVIADALRDWWRSAKARTRAR